MSKDPQRLTISNLGTLNRECLLSSFLPDAYMAAHIPILGSGRASIDSLISAYEERLNSRRKTTRKRTFPFWDNILFTEPQQNSEHALTNGENNEHDTGSS